MRRTQTTAVTAVALVGLAIQVAGGGGERLPSILQVCVADEATGFSWKDGGWIPTGIKPETYVVSKVEDLPTMADIKADLSLAFYAPCLLDRPEMGRAWAEAAIYNVCIAVHRVGSDSPDIMGCQEVHTKDDDSDDWKVKVNCVKGGNLAFEPNGPFQQGHFHGFLRPPKDSLDTNDTLWVEVGTCASFAGGVTQ